MTSAIQIVMLTQPARPHTWPVRLSDVEQDALARCVARKNLTIAQVIHRTLRTPAEPTEDPVSR